MGGAKNHGLILPDADLDQAVKDIMGAAYGSAGERCMALPVVVPVGKNTADELREQIIGVALDRAFLADPLPTDEFAFKRRIEEGRTRLNLIAQEVARLTGVVLIEYAAAARKLKDSKPPADVATDIAQQLQRLVPKRFLLQTP